MDSIKLKRMLEARLKHPQRLITYDKKSDKLRIEHKETGKGVTLSLPGLVGKYETVKEQIIDDMVYYVDEAMAAMGRNVELTGREKQIYPVIRSTSFPTETAEGTPLLYKDHTAETRIFYAIDSGKSYRLIDRAFEERENMTVKAIDEIARFNLRSLESETKKDIVAGNTFYFINYNDGYDASRILNQSLLEDINAQTEGELAIAVPHQDVLIFADIMNKQGYDVLAQMTMHFFSEGNIPITSLPFLFENGQLTPIFILAKNKPTEE